MADQGKAAENGEVNTSALRRASNWSQISYGTFIPFFALDSEYLKSLLIGKGYIRELEEPASANGFMVSSLLKSRGRSLEKAL